jgi:hypothetical protein
MDGCRKVITKELDANFIEICRAIHNYSFDIFAHRVTKHKHKLSDIWRYIEQDLTHFTPWQRSTLVDFLRHVDGIIKTIANAQASKQLSTISNRMLLLICSYWTKHKFLPKDAPADNTFPLLDAADTWLADGAVRIASYSCSDIWIGAETAVSERLSAAFKRTFSFVISSRLSPPLSPSLLTRPPAQDKLRTNHFPSHSHSLPLSPFLLFVFSLFLVL